MRRSAVRRAGARAFVDSDVDDEADSDAESVEIQVGPTRAKVHRSGSVDLQFLADHASDATSYSIKTGTKSKTRRPRPSNDNLKRSSARSSRHDTRTPNLALAPPSASYASRRPSSSVPVVSERNGNAIQGNEDIDAATSQILEFDRKLEASLARSGERNEDHILYASVPSSAPISQLQRQAVGARMEGLGGLPSKARGQTSSARSGKYLKWFRHTRSPGTDLVAQDGMDGEDHLEPFIDRKRAYRFTTHIPLTNQSNRDTSSRATVRSAHSGSLDESLDARSDSASRGAGGSIHAFMHEQSEHEHENDHDDDDNLAILRAPFDFLHSKGVDSFRTAQTEAQATAAAAATSDQDPAQDDAEASARGIGRSSVTQNNSTSQKRGAAERQTGRAAPLRAAASAEATAAAAAAAKEREEHWEKRLAKSERGHRKREMHLAQAIVDKERALEAREREMKKLQQQTLQLSRRVKLSAQRLAEQKKANEARHRKKLQRVEHEHHKERLTRGAIFLKHGRRGKPHLRLVYCDAQLQNVFYAKLDLKKVERTELKLARVERIEHGHKTPGFHRSGNKESVGACFSLVWADYTLNLEIPGYPKDMNPQHRERLLNAQRKDWLSAFHWAVARARGEIPADDADSETESDGSAALSEAGDAADFDDDDDDDFDGDDGDNEYFNGISSNNENLRASGEATSGFLDNK